jgi:RNA polymerase sigma-70 factor (ECF subfamily)
VTVEDWQRAQAGDEEAFRRLAEALWPRLYRLVWRTLSNPEDAEDVAQETLIRAWERLPGFQGRSRFDTWVMAIALNLARNHNRRLRPLSLDESAGREPIDRQPTPEAAVLAHEADTAFQSALHRLPPLWRVALELTAVEELTAMCKMWLDFLVSWLNRPFSARPAKVGICGAY